MVSHMRQPDDLQQQLRDGTAAALKKKGLTVQPFIYFNVKCAPLCLLVKTANLGKTTTELKDNKLMRIELQGFFSGNSDSGCSRLIQNLDDPARLEY
jgi:hypothetical protein